MNELDTIKQKFGEFVNSKMDELLLETGVAAVGIERAGGTPEDVEELYKIALEIIENRVSCIRN